MKYQLSDKEVRVIGCLLEKQVTTPEQYPMTLNGLTLACNQKTNRDPVMELKESEVQQTLDLLLKKHHLHTLSGFGSRVMKYGQRFCNSEFGNLKLSPAELAVVCTLLLRGAQTAGELRTRASRLHEFADVGEVEQVLQQLTTREDGPFVVRLAREPGKRENRFMHLFAGEITEGLAGEEEERLPRSSSAGLEGRVAALEEQVRLLQQRLDDLLS